MKKSKIPREQFLCDVPNYALLNAQADALKEEEKGDVAKPVSTAHPSHEQKPKRKKTSGA